MRTTIVLDDELLAKAQSLTNVQEKSSDNLPQAPVAFADEINLFIETHSLFGLGIGLIDAHLLASTQKNSVYPPFY